MKNRIDILIIVIVLINILLSISCNDDVIEPPSFITLEEKIDDLARNHIKVGGMIGIINKNQEKIFFSYGSKSINNDQPPDENTVFDIGSITKTFTAILTTDKYLKGEIRNDTVQYYFTPEQLVIPTKDTVTITFLHLMTHTSGIPRTPHESGSNFPIPLGYDPLNPYAAYTKEHVYEYLTNYCTLLFTPGTWWEYSNTAYGLLGHIIGLVDGTTYENVLTTTIFNALGMNNSSLFLTEAQLQNQALGHDQNNNIVPFYTANDIFQGAGMIKSSMKDMMTYLEANIGLIDTPLRQAMDYTYEIIMHQGSMGDQGLAWFILELDDGQTIIYSAGGTQGHSSFIGFNQQSQTGVVVLLNNNNHDGASIDLGKEIMKAINKY